MATGTLPTSVGKYKVIKKLSEGSSSHVFLVEHDGQTYALKYLHSSDESSFQRFRRESSALARLQHENLVKVYDIGEFQGRPFLVMEHLEGVTLEEEIGKEGRLEHELALKFIIKLTKAIGEIHRHGMVHRDIKPANTFYTKAGDVKLIDLGLVADINQIADETALIGTPLFCSPEQARVLKRKVDFRSDLYSIGITYFVMLTGRPPFTGQLSDILHQHAAVAAPDPREIIASVRPSVAAVIQRLLAKDPDDRYQSAAGLIHDLERLPEIDTAIEQGRNPHLGAFDRTTNVSRVQFVERKAEAEAIRLAWQNVEMSGAAVAIARGASGSGKSRLCQEFVDANFTSENLVLRSKCQPMNRHLPFGPLREALNNLIEDIETLPEAQRPALISKFREAAKGRESTVLRLSQNARRLLPKTGQSGGGRNFGAEGDRQAFLEGLSDFFVQLATIWGSCVFVLDDLQWMDEASNGVIKLILDKSVDTKFFVLSTARDDREHQEHLDKLRDLFGNRLILDLLVEAFSPQQIAELTRKYLGTEQVDDTIQAAIHSLSKGNPFVAIEFLRAAIESGALAFANGSWRLNEDSLQRLAMSENVYKLIVRRIDSSAADVKRLLQYGALFGNVFKPVEIAKVAKVEPDQLDRALKSCSDNGIIERVSSNKCRFVHDKIRESLAVSLKKDEERDMSAHLAEALMAYPEKSPEEVFAMARLFAVAGDRASRENAIKAHEQAGSLAYVNFAYREAYDLYQFAHLQLKGEDPARCARFAPELAICATMSGDDALATECSDLQIRFAKNLAETAHAHALKIWILTSQSSITSAWEHFKHTCDLIGKPFPDYLHLKLLHIVFAWAVSLLLEFVPVRLPKRLFFKSEEIDVNKMCSMYREAQLLCELRGNSLDFLLVSLRLIIMGHLVGGHKEKALGYAAVGFAYGSFGLRRMAVSYFNKSKASSELVNDPTVLALYEMRRLFGSFFCGIIKDFRPGYLEKKELIDRFLSPGELGRFLLMSGYFYGFRGLHREGIEVLTSTINAAEKQHIRLPAHSIISCMNQTWSQLSLVGRIQESQKLRSIALARLNTLRYCPPISRGAMAGEICARRVTGELDHATEEIVTCFWRRGNNRLLDPTQANVVSQLAFIRLLQLEKAQHFEEQYSLRAELNSMLRQMHVSLFCPVFRSNFYYVRGAYSRILGHYSFAELYYKKAEALASQFGGLRVLFDVFRDRARISKIKNINELKDANLASARALAHQHGWKPSLEQLVNEFGPEPSYMGRSGGSSTHAKSQHGMSSSSQPGAEGRTSQSSWAQQNTALTQMGIGETRLVDSLLKVSSAFITSVNPAEQTRAVLSEVVKLFAAERGFVFLSDARSGELSFLGGKDAKGNDLANSAGYCNTVVKKAFQTGETVVTAGSEDAEALGAQSAILYGLRSIIATPLVVKGKIEGVVYLDSKLSKGLFDVEDSHLFKTLVSQIAISFELARMAQVEIEKANLTKQLEIQSAIATEARKVEVLVDNVQQALFSVSSTGAIIEPVSKYAEKVFGGKIEGASVYETLYKEISQEQRSSLDTVFTTVFGANDLQWELMQEYIPRRVVIGQNLSEDEQKILKIMASAIYNNEEIEKILFVVEDVSDLERMEMKMKRQNRQADALNSILDNDRRDLQKLFDGVRKVLGDCADLQEESSDSPRIKQILRDLHTLKGNSRFVRFDDISEKIHEVETVLAETTAAGASGLEFSRVLTSESRKIAPALAQTEALFNRFYAQSSGQSGTTAPINEVALKELGALIREFGARLQISERKRLGQALKRVHYHSLKRTTEKFQTMVNDICKQLGKQVQIEVIGDAFVSEGRLGILQECLLHLIRNSLDHGIEMPEARLANNKLPSGTVRVHFVEQDDGLTVKIEDDGQGIDGDRVLTKAIEKGVVSSEEAKRFSAKDKIHLIFRPSFSTKEQATDISGRGVGMDVVKQNIENARGTIDIDTKPGSGTTFVIRLPDEEDAALANAS